MSQSEIRHMAKIVPAIRSSLKYEYADRPIPVYRVKAEAVAEPIVEVNEGVGVFSFKHQVPPSMRVPRRRVLYNEKKQIGESIEINKKYAERAETPKSEFIKCDNHEQLFDLIMKDKKEKGWKFKDES